MRELLGELDLLDVVCRLPPVGLADLDERASLQTRTDLKYVVPVDIVTEMIDDLRDRFEVLTIDDRTVFGYESIYFDTPDLLAHYASATKRRRRFKVRTRSYTDSGVCMLEVKTRGHRGLNVKHRQPHPSQARHVLGDGESFVSSALCDYDVDPRQLHAALATTYSRITLTHRTHELRVTVDMGLRAWRTQDPDRVVAPEFAVIETKAIRSPTPVDRWLWRVGHRPARLSKYCTSMAALDPTVRSNRWSSVLPRFAPA